MGVRVEYAGGGGGIECSVGGEISSQHCARTQGHQTQECTGEL